MSYNDSIPKPTDTLQSSQGDLLNNFIAIKSFVDVDHKTFGDANEGAHAKVTLPDFAAVPTFTGTNAGIYAQNCTLTSKNELYSHVTGRTDAPFTASRGSEPVDNGWTYLPSGILLKWGRGVRTGIGQSVLFPESATIPKFTEIYNVQISSYAGGDLFVCHQGYTISGFTVSCTKRTAQVAATVGFEYLVIGR